MHAVTDQERRETERPLLRGMPLRPNPTGGVYCDDCVCPLCNEDPDSDLECACHRTWRRSEIRLFDQGALDAG
ncbi:hypothetical protein [Nocardia sp. NBC_01327]|uniref:hypothetical protein n=1 Tax=Nocardia sp. NBC_01327 TaxID=2903593 RepID=UPI002E15CB53|nr:hypothetical protein OG326_42820 [Nocardia sp. NBC_01327]